MTYQVWRAVLIKDVCSVEAIRECQKAGDSLAGERQHKDMW